MVNSRITLFLCAISSSDAIAAIQVFSSSRQTERHTSRRVAPNMLNSVLCCLAFFQNTEPPSNPIHTSLPGSGSEESTTNSSQPQSATSKPLTSNASPKQ